MIIKVIFELLAIAIIVIGILNEDDLIELENILIWYVKKQVKNIKK